MSTKFWETFSVFWKYGSKRWKEVYVAIIKGLTSDIFLAIAGSSLVLLLTLNLGEVAHTALNTMLNEAGLGKSEGLLKAIDILSVLIGFLALVIIWLKYSSVKRAKQRP